MLTTQLRNRSWRRGRASQQHGLVLLLALIALVIMTLAAIAMVRSVSSSNIIAGNLAFQQAATASADQGVETAVVWLENNNSQTSTATGAACTAGTGNWVLSCNQAARGYFAARTDPSASQSWQDFWTALVNGGGTPVTLPADTAGNTVSYFIQRMCSSVGDYNSGSNSCSISPAAVDCGTSHKAGGQNLNCPTQIYYRITVRVDGPRNTSSYTQAMVAL